MVNHDYAKRTRDKAIKAILEGDAGLIEAIFFDLQRAARNKHSKLRRLLKQNADAYLPQETIRWWKEKKGGLPTSLAFLEHCIEEGEQPVFCNVSLYVLSSAPTLYVPVPYATAKEGFHGFRKTIWLNAPSEPLTCMPSAINWEGAAREYSHAIANISYSVRVGDLPKRGWLSQAHAENSAIYLPDVTCAEGDDVETVAVAEELYLGMASVLYIPLTYEERLPKHAFDENEPNSSKYEAQAVLMLWSPVPHRWNRLIESTESNIVNKCSWCSWETGVVTTLGSILRWLGDIIIKDRADRLTNDTQLLALIHTLDLWAAHSASGVWIAFRSLIHSLGGLLDHLRKEGVEQPTPLTDWLLFLLGKHGLVNELQWGWSRSLCHTPIVIKRAMDPKDVTFITMDKAEEVIHAKIPKTAELALDEQTANQIGLEPASNIVKYDSDLNEIEIILSKSYITLRYIVTPTAHAVEKLLGSDKCFQRYLGIRRGLMVPSEQPGSSTNYGIGLSLFSAVATKAKISRRLYLSPDGRQCYIELALPYQERLD